MEKLKILVINNLYPPQVIGGYERALADYARLLYHRGHEVLVVTANVEGLPTSYKKSEPEPFEVRRDFLLYGTWTNEGSILFSLEQWAKVIIQNRIALAQVLRSFQPQVCLAGNMDLLGIEVIEQLLAADIPVAHYVMNSVPGYPVDFAPRSCLYRYISVSNWIREKLGEQGYPIETAQTIYPGAEVEVFYQAELPPRDRLRIVYASLVMPYKGADVFVEALSILHAAGVDFTATIAGGSLQPQFVEELKRFVESEGFQERVHFAGLLTRQELKQLYRTHNVWVLPSRFEEPFSIGLLEAMIAGLTIVVSNTGGSPEAVEHGKSGLIFESENPLDLADCLFSLTRYPEEWEALARQGQQRGLSHFNRTHTMDQLESLLYEMASKTRPSLATAQLKSL